MHCAGCFASLHHGSMPQLQQCKPTGAPILPLARRVLVALTLH